MRPPPLAGGERGGGWLRSIPVALTLVVATISTAAAAAPVCRYDAILAADLGLAVAVACDPAVTGFAPPSPAIAPFVHDLVVGPGAKVRYRVDLPAAAAVRDSIDVAVRSGEAIIAAGPAWLLRPEGPDDTVLEVRVATAPGLGFAAAAGDVPRYTAAGLDYAGFAVFGRFERVPGTAAQLIVLDGGLELDRADLAAWVAGRLAAADRFWRGATTRHPFVAVIPVADGGGVMFGLTRGGGGPGIALFLGEHTEAADLAGDWVLAHELVHAGMPFLPGAPWLMEGLAVYLEPVIRARAGLLPVDDLWRGFARSLDRGAAVLAAGPIDGAGFPDLYWGGAVLMLLADVETRRASGGRLGLEDCLVPAHDDLGDAAQVVPADTFIATCEAILGAPFADLIHRHLTAGASVDLAALWRDLGIVMTGDTLTFDDTAALAWIRHAITQGAPPSP